MRLLLQQKRRLSARTTVGLFLAAALALPVDAVGQRAADQLHTPRAGDPGEPHPDDVQPIRHLSAFQLRGLADFAMVGMRNRANLSHAVPNDAGPVDYYGVTGNAVEIFNTPRGTNQVYFNGPAWVGAPRSEWERARALAPSLDAALGGGFTTAQNEHPWFFTPKSQLRAADNQLGQVHAGAGATDNGNCLDFTGEDVVAGTPVGAASDCPESWGAEQFAGAQRKIEFERWVDYFNDVGPESFTWDWWRVPEEYVSDQLLGDFQTYYSFVDWAADYLATFGSVVPGGSGDPVSRGWPMGITFKVDAFSYQLPSVADVTYWQALVINDSEKVYGVPIDYQELFVGHEHGFLLSNAATSQYPAVYYRSDLGAMFVAGNGLNPNCNGADVPPGVGGCAFDNTGHGAAAIVVLNSPIGDLRNKLFSNPESPFFSPGHPLEGDTITFNHGRICTFGASCYSATQQRSKRAAFGLMASRPIDLLDGRTPGDYDALSVQAWWNTFRNHDYPARTLAFNSWAVPGWDYDRDGVTDTLYLDTCLGPERGGSGCVEIFSDTMPGGQNNARGNFGGAISVGPFALAAGDTAKLTFAHVAGTTPGATIENVRNAIDFYQNAFLGPSAPPPVNVVTARTQPGDRGRDPGAQVQLFIDDALEQFEDPFLTLLANQQEGTARADLNPWLVDSLRTVAQNNVRRLLIFKSCDFGVSFTSDGNCVGDPTADTEGDPVDLGWEPWMIIEPEDGEFPNVVVDEDVTAGKTYMYVFIGQTQGFEALILEPAAEGDPQPQLFVGAPSLFNPLSTSTSDPNVVTVYVPASRMAGSRDAAVEFTDQTPRLLTPTLTDGVEAPLIDVLLTGDVAQQLQFQAVFGDSVVVREVRAEDGSASTEVRVFDTVVTSEDGATLIRAAIDSATFTSASAEGIAVGGGTTTVTEDNGSQITTTVFNELTMVVVGATGEPLFVSSNLGGDAATPGSLFGRTAFPQLIVSVDNPAPSFVADTWFEEVSADSAAQIRAAGEPDLDWLEGNSTSSADQLGVYRIDFEGPEFGPARTFTISLANPAQTEAALATSLEARPVAQTTATSAEVAAALGVEPEELVAVALPFTVTNVATGQAVTVAMLAEDKRETIPLGSLENQITVGVPEDIWVPGEPLVFLERVPTFRTAETGDGESYVVLENGAPVVVDSLRVTFSQATLGCGGVATCNPLTRNTPGANAAGYLAVRPTDFLRVAYGSAITPQSSFAFRVDPAVTGLAVEEVTREDLENIKVVPNPYVVFSAYEQARDVDQSRLMFMGLPPEGTVTIFTVSGQVVQRITYTADDLSGNGDLYWNMRTLENNDIAAGLYLFVVEGQLPASGRSVKKLGKFVVIR